MCARSSRRVQVDEISAPHAVGALAFLDLNGQSVLLVGTNGGEVLFRLPERRHTEHTILFDGRAHDEPQHGGGGPPADEHADKKPAHVLALAVSGAHAVAGEADVVDARNDHTATIVIGGKARGEMLKHFTCDVGQFTDVAQARHRAVNECVCLTALTCHVSRRVSCSSFL